MTVISSTYLLGILFALPWHRIAAHLFSSVAGLAFPGFQASIASASNFQE
jgi:hypothetical protein